MRNTPSVVAVLRGVVTSTGMPAAVALVVVALFFLAGACRRDNPAYHPLGSVPLDGAAPDMGSSSGGAPVGTGGDTGAGTGGMPDGSGGARTGGRGGGGSGGTTDAGRIDGAGCVDNDGDGFGTGAGCLGADCDDSDPAVTRTGARACYSGPAGTRGVGVCRAGAELCVAGVWSACNGQNLPGGEACNGEDDDCNGTVDDKLPALNCGLGTCARQMAACSAGKLNVCPVVAPVAAADECDGIDNDCDGAIDEDCATCVRVAPSGEDTDANGTDKPFRTLQAAINHAAMDDHPKRVCVAGGATCLDKATYTSPSGMPALTMANGVSVYGNYESATWTRCALSLTQLVSSGPTVTLETQGPAGVVFPASVNTPTVLDGFAFLRAKGDGLASTTAVTVDGAKQVTLANLVVVDAPSAVATWGVNLINGASALITRSLIAAGNGSSESVAVRSVGAAPVIRDNCSTVDATTGRCSATSCTSGLGLRGRVGNSGPSTASGTSAVVALRDSPGAVVERNTICGATASEAAGVRISGGAAGTVIRGNVITATGGSTESHGVWLDACADATPWIVDNEAIVADGAAGADAFGVRALGACHPIIDSNVRIQGGGETAAERVGGVLCGTAASAASRCVVVNNKSILGAPTNRPLASAGVVCEGGACARVAGNVIGGGAGVDVVGVAITNGGALLERNTITGGCGSKTTAGVLAENTTGRIENNVVRGGVCPANSTNGGSVWGLHIHVGGGGNELEVHSNTVLAGGTGPCQGAAVIFGTAAAGAAVSPRKGIFRNNIMRAGACSSANYPFWEDSPPSEPRVFENNDLDPTAAQSALYLDNNATPLTSIAAVNGLSGTMAAGNISGDPQFVSATDLHLAPGSACVNAGTATGAPPRDFAGKARDAKPDIGAYEQ